LSGIVRPSAFAVLRLMTNSSLVTCSAGILAGFSPLCDRHNFLPGAYAVPFHTAFVLSFLKPGWAFFSLKTVAAPLLSGPVIATLTFAG
jgi:hypothetical protein